MLNIFALYFTLLIAIGFTVSQKMKSITDFIVGSHSVNYWVTAIATQASDMGSWLFSGPLILKKLNLNMAALLLFSCVETTFSMMLDDYLSYEHTSRFAKRYSDEMLQILRRYRQIKIKLNKEKQKAQKEFFHDNNVRNKNEGKGEENENKKNLVNHGYRKVNLEEFNNYLDNRNSIFESENNAHKICKCLTYLTLNHPSFNIETTDLNEFVENQPIIAYYNNKDFRKQNNHHINYGTPTKKQSKLLKNLEDYKKEYLPLEQKLNNIMNKGNGNEIALANHTSKINQLIDKIKRIRDKYGKLTNLDLSRFNIFYLINPASKSPCIEIDEIKITLPYRNDGVKEFVMHTYDNFPYKCNSPSK